MPRFDRQFMDETKNRLDVEVLGVASVETSRFSKLAETATALLPSAKSVVVVAKEVYRGVVRLLGPSKTAGEAERGCRGSVAVMGSISMETTSPFGPIRIPPPRQRASFTLSITSPFLLP